MLFAAICVEQSFALFFRLKYTCTTFWGNFCDGSKFLVPNYNIQYNIIIAAVFSSSAS